MVTVGARASVEPSEWSKLPTDRVVRLEGFATDPRAVDLDLLPADAPVVIRYELSEVMSAQDVVNDILDDLQSVAMRFFPAWLPDGDVLTTTTNLDRHVARMLAGRLAAQSDHFGPFLADLAEAALVERAPSARFSSAVRARGLSRILKSVYQRGEVVLLLERAVDLDEAGQGMAATALSWLADHAIGIWLTGDVLPAIDRFPTTRLWVAAPPTQVSIPRPKLVLPKPPGIPASEIERRLAHALSRAEWAVGHEWNKRWSASPLAPDFFVDLMWHAERCVVELDGPDHRGPHKYAADRQRDNALHLQGFRVLRFTNEQVVSDLALVLRVIKTMLTQLRHEGNLI